MRADDRRLEAAAQSIAFNEAAGRQHRLTALGLVWPPGQHANTTDGRYEVRGSRTVNSLYSLRFAVYADAAPGRLFLRHPDFTGVSAPTKAAWKSRLISARAARAAWGWAILLATQ